MWYYFSLYTYVDADISGVALKMLDRSCLKEMGITSLWKQLQILSHVKGLIGMCILIVFAFLHNVFIYHATSAVLEIMLPDIS